MTGTRGAPRRDAYRASGVDVAAGERAVDLMRGHVDSTHRPEVVGGLGGFGGDVPTFALMGRNASAFGIYVGSRENFEAMNVFIEKHKLKPVIDRTFDFADAKAAFDHMRSGDFVGKIVIQIGGA